MTRHLQPRQSGFALLEVLVAVVVLSFGLLALAALQGTLFKTAGEAKAQSAALALATEKMEYFRGYQDLPAYQAIASNTTGETINLGGIAYTRKWTVSRYGYPVGGGNFAQITTLTGATPNTYVANNEFKRVLVDVTWNDAQSAQQHVALEEAIAAIDPKDSAKVAKLTGTALPRGPEVRIYNPAQQQQGVIPIAIGNGTDTAATNPKPLVNGSNVIETRFDVMTYGDLNGSTATAQARVETSIVGCSCDYGNAPSSGAMRPTYWDGTRYTIPEAATAVLGASFVPLAGPDASATQQSSLCTICCRDHHDPAALPTDAAKFDPRNPNHSAGHYLVDASGNLVGSGPSNGPRTSGKYTEACRVIRVGGLYRVAADSYNDYQNFLATKNDSSTTAYLPTATATTNYQNFVKGYLDQRIVNQGTQANWNNVLPISAPASVTSLESANSVYRTQPNTITYQKNDPAKWLHLRGLYVDYLEPKALQAIADAKSGCTAAGGGAPSASDLETCVLKVLPFTSINLTELGNYTPLSGTQIVVANNNFADTLSSTAPVRGKVTLGSAPVNGQTTNAYAILRRSNSGLTTLLGGIDTEDAGTSPPATWTATQPYTPQGNGSGGGGTGGAFTTTLYVGSGTGTAYPFASNILTPYVNSSLTGVTCNGTGNPITCTSASSLGGSQTITVGNYNYQVNGTSSAALTCTNGLGGTMAYSGAAYQTKTCRNYAVSSVALNGTQVVAGPISPNGTDGLKNESTSFSISSPAINNTDVLRINFSTPVDTPQPLTCTYTTVTHCNNGGHNCTTSTVFTVTADDCP
jgi:type II secretory pathway pseudopilin PulG